MNPENQLKKKCSKDNNSVIQMISGDSKGGNSKHMCFDSITNWRRIVMVTILYGFPIGTVWGRVIRKNIFSRSRSTKFQDFV